jgi:hypothetical protein
MHREPAKTSWPCTCALKENEAEARQRLRAFWAGSSLGRPALMAVVRGGPVPPLPGDPWTAQSREAREWNAEAIEAYTDWWLSHLSEQWLAESMPRTAMGPGSTLALPAALAGAEYAYGDASTAWIKPIPDLWNRPLPRFDPQAPKVRLLMDCVAAQLRAVKGRAFVNPPIYLDALTTLSQLRRPEQLCLDVIEHPVEVVRWSAALTDLIIETYEHAYRLLLRSGHGEAGSFFTLMAEGRMEAVQCDFAVMLSPAQFERFVLPDLRRMTDYLDFSLYHLDGTCQMRFLDALRSLPKLNGIQWNPEPPADPPTRWIEAFREIRRRGFCLAIGCGSVEEAVVITQALGPDGLALFLPAFPSRAEAEAAIRRIEQACQRRGPRA